MGEGGIKGHLGCIEILKAKAAIMSDRLCVTKAQQEMESQGRSFSKLLPLLSSSQDKVQSQHFLD